MTERTVNTDERLRDIRARAHDRTNSKTYTADIDFLLSLVDGQAAGGRQARISTLDEHGFRTADYSDDERAVCDYLQSRMPDVGCGNDPIGFLIASHNWAVHERNEANDAATRMRDKCVGVVRKLACGVEHGDALLSAKAVIAAIEALTLDQVGEKQDDKQ